jgi:sortase A
LPGGGEPGRRGTAVYAAHRDTHFRFLKDLKPGDRLVVEGVDGVSQAYRVTGARVVRRDRFGVDRNARTPSIALTTCWPFEADQRGPWRYVVAARVQL